MKKLIFTLITLQSILITSGQEQELRVLESDSTWLKETIKFPLGFAPKLDYQGYDDVRFSKDWRNPDSDAFFTYAYVWNINLSILPTVSSIEQDMRLFYDGLMTAVNRNKDVTVPKTIATFTEIESKKGLPGFNGTLQIYDSFATKKVITLYANVETQYCATQKRYVLFFKISSKTYDHYIWKRFETLKLKENFCDFKP